MELLGSLRLCPDRMYFSIDSFFSFLFTALCKRCKEHLANLMTDFSVEKNPDLYGVGEASPTLVVPEVVLPSEANSPAAIDQKNSGLFTFVIKA